MIGSHRPGSSHLNCLRGVRKGKSAEYPQCPYPESLALVFLVEEPFRRSINSSNFSGSVHYTGQSQSASVITAMITW